MSETSYTIANKNRRFRNLPSNPWIPYVGDCKALDKFLDSKEHWGWEIPKFVNGALRGVSQVVFANNPLTGLLILLSLFWADALVGAGAVLAVTLALLTSHLMREERKRISAGLTSYNAVLLGTVTIALWKPLYHEEVNMKVWSVVAVGAIFSVFVTSGLTNILGSFRNRLPCLTMPFNVVAIILFLCFMPSPIPNADENISETTEALMEEDVASSINNATNSTYLNENELNWGNMLNGIIVSMSNIYGVENLIGSILMFIGIMIYSPLMALMCLSGAILGSISGLLFASSHDEVYSGLWGFNAILSASAVGGYFIVMTCHSFFIAMGNVLFTVIIQQGLFLAFSKVHLPVFTLPFVLSTLLFLSVTTGGNQLPRVQNFSFPEMHKFEYLEEERKRKNLEAGGEEGEDEKAQQNGSESEKKDLVLKEIKAIKEDEEPEKKPAED